MKCEDCFYWDKKENTRGVCRKKPPVIVVDHTYGDLTIETEWPRPLKNDWCGEFKVKSDASRVG